MRFGMDFKQKKQLGMFYWEIRLLTICCRSSRFQIIRLYPNASKWSILNAKYLMTIAKLASLMAVVGFVGIDAEREKHIKGMFVKIIYIGWQHWSKEKNTAGVFVGLWQYPTLCVGTFAHRGFSLLLFLQLHISHDHLSLYITVNVCNL